MSLQDILMQRAALHFQNELGPTEGGTPSTMFQEIAKTLEQRRQEKIASEQEKQKFNEAFGSSNENSDGSRVRNVVKSATYEKGKGTTIKYSLETPSEERARTAPTTAQLEAAKQGIPILSEKDMEETPISGGDFGLLNKIAEQNRIKSESEEKIRLQEVNIKEQERVAKLVNDIDDDIRSTKSIQDYSTIERAGANIQSAYERAINADTKSKNAADQALIISFNKMLDPGSVVRESEYARTPAGEALINQIRGRLQQLTAGGSGLTDENRKEILLMTQDLVKNAKEFAKRDVEIYRKRAEQFSVPVDLLYGGFLKDDVSAESGSSEGVTSSGTKFRRL